MTAQTDRAPLTQSDAPSIHQVGTNAITTVAATSPGHELTKVGAGWAELNSLDQHPRSSQNITSTTIQLKPSVEKLANRVTNNDGTC